MSEQKTQSQQKQNREDMLLDIINRSSAVINGLAGNGAWDIVLGDVEKQRKNLDDNWQFVSDDKKMHEFRVTKMAVMKILNLLQDYTHDKELAQNELHTLQNPVTIINKDVDEE